MQSYDILVAGEINPDLILSGDVVPAFGQVEKLVDSAVLAVGSSSVITACGAARLGLKVAFIGVCGEDLFGRFMLEEMQERGVDTSAVIVDPARSTGLTVVLNRPIESGSRYAGEAPATRPSRQVDRAMLTFPGAIAALTAADVDDSLLARARHLHVASYFLQTALQPGLPDLFARAHALGLTTSLDTNWDPSGEWRGFERLLRQVDVFLPNENEAKAIAGMENIESATQRLNDSCRVVAVKLGGEGALLCHEKQIARVPALKVDVVDTVGAGDTFNAGFLYGFLGGWPLERSLRLAAACGSLSTRAAGGTAAQPTLAEAIGHVPG